MEFPETACPKDRQEGPWLSLEPHGSLVCPLDRESLIQLELIIILVSVLFFCVTHGFRSNVRL